MNHLAACVRIAGAIALGGIGLLTVLPAAAQSSGLVSGTIAVHGCRPGDVVQVRVTPLLARREVSPPPALVLDAVPTGPGKWSFELRDLDPERAWRIGVRVRESAVLPAGACGGLRWSANREPVVRPGDAPLRFDGYAVRARIEIRADQTLADPLVGSRPVWVGADDFDPLDPAQGVRTLRWRTGVSGVDGGRLQVSLVPFPRIADARYDPCVKDGRTVAPLWSQDFPAVPGRWSEVAVDFHALLARRDGARASTSASGGDADAVKTELGQPVYVRVLPLVAGAPDCRVGRHGTPPEAIFAKVRKRPLPTPPVTDPSITMAGPATYVNPTFVSQRPNGKHKPCYRALADHKMPFDTLHMNGFELMAYLDGKAFPNGVLKKGQWFCGFQGSSDEGWFESAIDSVGSVLSAVVDGVGKIVDFTSSAWESIQDGVVAVVGDVVTATGIVDCGEGSACESALKAGLEIALASMGVPPSLPNFDQLVDQGFDYMAAQVASQVGAPPELADYASAQAQAFVKKAAKDLRAQQGHPKLPAWLEPTLNFAPAAIVVPLRGAGKAYPYASTPLVMRKNSVPYLGATLALPRMLPGAAEPALKFPMTLPPDLFYLPPPPAGNDDYSSAFVDKENWLTLRYDACYHFYLIALSTPGGVQKVADFSFHAKTSLGCTP
jgi:hypothetical protein